MSNRNLFLACVCMIILALNTGCAQWSTPAVNHELASLPRPKLAPDSVVFEVTFVRIPSDNTDFAERFWPDVDESIIPTQLRRHLTANGFRSGMIGSPLPTALQEVLDLQPPMDPQGGTKMIDPNRQVTARTSRLRSRTGQTGKIIVRSNPVAHLAILSYDEEGHVSGESLSMAQSLFSITSYALGDGRVRLELVPTVEHGQPKSRFRGENGAWMVDNTSRDMRVFEDMKLEATLNPGEAVTITSSDADRGLGSQFFGADPAEKLPRLMLVVRLQQTQADDRFEGQEITQPVASVLD